jgi:L-ascorbate metabolism protein UlaG (beta-lactamase superfamily)
MHFVHYGHSCVLLDTGTARLLFDPGVFSSFQDVRGVDAVLITHLHADHLDPARLPALLEVNPGAQLVVDADSAAVVRDLGLEPTVVEIGTTLTVAGVRVKPVGGTHAEIHREIPRPANAGYIVADGAFYHPGDALHVPEESIDVLGVPVGAPWLRLGEAVDFTRAVAPRVAVPIHERTLSEAGIQIAVSRVQAMAPEKTTTTVLPSAQETEV